MLAHNKWSDDEGRQCNEEGLKEKQCTEVWNTNIVCVVVSVWLCVCAWLSVSGCVCRRMCGCVVVVVWLCVWEGCRLACWKELGGHNLSAERPAPTKQDTCLSRARGWRQELGDSIHGRRPIVVQQMV